MAELTARLLHTGVTPPTAPVGGFYTADAGRFTECLTRQTWVAREKDNAALEALQRVNTAKVTRQHLDGFDASGKALARFEARHMK